MSIRYTDGEQIEARIGELVRAEKDLRSHLALGLDHYDSWPVKYHLSPERANLLRPFDFSGLDVLELGAGMGAVSRYLAENARSLTVVEGTEARFSVLRERLRDLYNWQGVVDNIQDVELEKQFDVVCVIGVLEYSALYIKPPQGESPFAYFLRKAASFLKPEGVLVLAIENQLGMKYWSGSAEDHTARLFDGIAGYAPSRTPRTFSRRQLLDLISGAGFAQVDQYFPFPDYKIPTSVLSARLLEKSPGLAADIASSQPFQNYGNPNVKYFPDGLALKTVAEAGLMADFANSFLFAASRQAESPIRRQLLGEQAVGWYFSNHRKLPTKTVFRESEGGIAVEKTALLEDPSQPREVATPDIGTIRWHAIPPEPVASGTPVRSLLARCAYFEDWKLFEEILRSYLAWAFRRWGKDDNLNGEALDAIFVNAALPKGKVPLEGEVPQEFVVFDCEWKTESLPKTWFIFRNVYNLIRDEGLLSNSGFASLSALYEKLCRHFSLVPALERDIQREASLQAATSNQAQFHRHYLLLKMMFDRPFPASSLPRVPAVEARLRTDFFRIEAENAQLHATLNSLPHKITAKVCRLGGKIPMLATVLKGLIAPVYAFLKAARRRWRKTGWLPLVTTRDGFEFVHGHIPPQGFAKIECKGDFSKSKSGKLFVTLSVTGEASATLQVPLIFVKSKRAYVLVRDIGEVENPRLTFYPHGSVTEVGGMRIKKLSRLGAVKELVKPWLRNLTKRGEAEAFFGRLTRFLRFDRGRNFKSWVKQELFRLSVPPTDLYSCWSEKYDTLTEQDRKQIRERVRVMPYCPLISIIMPVYNTDERWLSAAIDSVLGQLYPNWELCIADDRSGSIWVKDVLERYRLKDPRIRIVYREKNGHISAASNSALELASGEFIALLDHDDELAPHSLYMVAEELNRHPQTDLIYSDEDKMDTHGRRYAPHFKPDWNLDLFFSLNLVTHLAVFRTSIIKKIGGFRIGFEGSQDYDLTLRAVEQTTPDKIRHIPHVLYHWRAIPGSVALAAGEKTYAHDAARRAIKSHLDREGIPAEVRESYPYLHRVIYAIPEPAPKVTAIICTKDRRDLLETIVSGLLKRTDYPALELIIVDNQSSDPATLDYFKELLADSRVRILRYDAPFNFSAMNNYAASEAKSELLLFLNNDLKVIEADWLKEMVRFAIQSDIGAVGAKLIYPNGHVQHAGVVLGIGGVAAHVHWNFPRREGGYFGRARVVQSWSAVTAACLMMRREVFEKVKGFDAENLAVAYNDIDLCLRVRELGKRIVWTPYAELYHMESASRGSDQTEGNLPRFLKETQWMKRKWGKLLQADPAYNPNLSLVKTDFSLAFPPRTTKPWREVAPKATGELAYPPINPAELRGGLDESNQVNT